MNESNEVHVFNAYADTLSEDELSRVTECVENATRSFPEIDGTVYVGRLSDDFGWNNENVVARADSYNRVLYFPEGEVPSSMTVYHELGHLAIRVLDENGEDVPTSSEEYCSIFSVSRMTTRDIDETDIPYLGKPWASVSDWSGICQRALEYREENHDYIKKCKEWLRVDEYSPENPAVAEAEVSD